MEHNQLILSAKDVNIQFNLRGKVLHAIRGIDLDLYQGEVLAIVGESGSGKSVFTKSFMGLLDANGSITSGTIDYYGMADGNGGIFKTDLVEQGYFDPFAINNDYEGTVEKARTLLKAAGYKFGDDGMLSAETPISLEYLTNEATSHVKIGEAMQQDLAAIGIDMTIKQCDWNVFLQERKNGNFDFAREGWIADFNDPINMLEMWITGSGNNDCQYGR